MIPKPLITYIETAIIPRYKEFDKHTTSHTSAPSSKKALPSPGNIPKRTNAWHTSLPPTMTRDCAATAPPTTLSPARY